MRETWYVLESGENADPRDVAPDDKGVLRHKSGVAVAIGSHGNPMSRGVDVDDPKPAVRAGPPTPRAEPIEKLAKSPRNRQVKAEDDSGAKYKTR